ncbi:hypothetical protein J6590_064437 [Homalodisca vitripennis]|nr:hypothetical protein J6590_064437 [Homalodisca vitripennis]
MSFIELPQPSLPQQGTGGIRHTLRTPGAPTTQPSSTGYRGYKPHDDSPINDLWFPCTQVIATDDSMSDDVFELDPGAPTTQPSPTGYRGVMAIDDSMSDDVFELDDTLRTPGAPTTQPSPTGYRGVMATDDSMSDDVFELDDTLRTPGAPTTQPSPTGYRGVMATDDSMSDDVFESDDTLRTPGAPTTQPSPTGYRGYKPPEDLFKDPYEQVEELPHKTILLGDSGVGKTSLLVQFDTGKFQTGTFSATVGIGFTVSDWLLNLQPVLAVSTSCLFLDFHPSADNNTAELTDQVNTLSCSLIPTLATSLRHRNIPVKRRLAGRREMES